jgi:hypothetical protein
MQKRKEAMAAKIAVSSTCFQQQRDAEQQQPPSVQQMINRRSFPFRHPFPQYLIILLPDGYRLVFGRLNFF